MNDLLVLNAFQAEMASTQNRTWANVQERFDAFEQNFHIHRDCNQKLFSNQELNFNFDTLCFLLAMNPASIKSYRSALFAYRVNFLNAIPVLLRSHLPMSLTPMDSLIVMLESVAIQSKAADRVSLTIPMTDVLSYYDSRLLAKSITVPEGFLLTLNIPLASHQTCFTIFDAKWIPMPHRNDTQVAFIWAVEAPYLAISTKWNRLSCPLCSLIIVSVRSSTEFVIFFPTEIGFSSCIATLFLDSSVDSLSVFDTSVVSLPTTEQTTKLGFGIWLVTSASDDFFFRESHATSPSSKTQPFFWLSALHHHTWVWYADHGQDHENPIWLIQLLSDTGHQFASFIAKSVGISFYASPPSDELLLYDPQAETGVKPLKEVRKKLKHSPRVREVNHLVEMARPFASDLKLLKPSLMKELTSKCPSKFRLLWQSLFLWFRQSYICLSCLFTIIFIQNGCFWM